MSKKFPFFSIHFCLLLLIGGLDDALAKERRAVVILKSTSAPSEVNACQGTAELSYIVLEKPRVNGKKELRLSGSIEAADQSTAIGKEPYKDAKKTKLEKMSLFGWSRSSASYAVPASERVLVGVDPATRKPVLALPDARVPQSNRPSTLAEIYQVMLSGEDRSEGRKRQVKLPLQEVNLVYLLTASQKPEEALWEFASKADSIPMWNAFLEISAGHQASQALEALQRLHMKCANQEIESFQSGEFTALDRAEQYGQKALSLSGRIDLAGASRQAQELLSRVSMQREELAAALAASVQLTEQGKWDEALESMRPALKYRSDLPELEQAYRRSNQESFDLHYSAAQSALESKRFDKALEEFEIALKRKPASLEASKNRNETLVLQALKQSQRMRARGNAEEVVSFLEDLIQKESGLKDESRIQREVQESRCELSEQLSEGIGEALADKLTESLAGVSKEELMGAHQTLKRAASLCPSNNAALGQLDQVKGRLASQYLKAARKALTLDNAGTALLHIDAAQSFQGSTTDSLQLYNEARQLFENKKRIRIGLVVRDNTGKAKNVGNQLRSYIESALLRQNPNLRFLQDADEALQQIRGSGASGSCDRTATCGVLSIEINSFYMDRSPSDERTVPSSYQTFNPQHDRLQKQLESLKIQYQQCKYSNPTTYLQTCQGIANSGNRTSLNLRRTSRYTRHEYAYRERNQAVDGSLVVSLRIDNNVQLRTELVGDANRSIHDACLERSGVHQQDRSTSDQSCALRSDYEYMNELIEQMKYEFESSASEAVQKLPMAYFKRARSSRPEVALEDYITFLVLGRADENPTELNQATDFILKADMNFRRQALSTLVN